MFLETNARPGVRECWRQTPASHPTTICLSVPLASSSSSNPPPPDPVRPYLFRILFCLFENRFYLHVVLYFLYTVFISLFRPLLLVPAFVLQLSFFSITFITTTRLNSSHLAGPSSASLFRLTFPFVFPFSHLLSHDWLIVSSWILFCFTLVKMVIPAGLPRLVANSNRWDEESTESNEREKRFAKSVFVCMLCVIASSTLYNLFFRSDTKRGRFFSILAHVLFEIRHDTK